MVAFNFIDHATKGLNLRRYLSRDDPRDPQAAPAAVSSARFVRTIQIPRGAALAGAGRNDACGRIRKRGAGFAGNVIANVAVLHAFLVVAQRSIELSGGQTGLGELNLGEQWTLSWNILRRVGLLMIAASLRPVFLRLSLVRAEYDFWHRWHGVRSIHGRGQVLERDHGGPDIADHRQRRAQPRRSPVFPRGRRVRPARLLGRLRRRRSWNSLSRSRSWPGMGSRRDLGVLANLLIEPIPQEPGLFRLHFQLRDAAAVGDADDPDLRA